MDRNSFLKTFAAGLSVPSLLAGCSTDSSSEKGILQSSDGSAAEKTASSELYISDENDFKYKFREYESDSYLLLNPTGKNSEGNSGYFGKFVFSSTFTLKAFASFCHKNKTLSITAFNNSITRLYLCTVDEGTYASGDTFTGSMTEYSKGKVQDPKRIHFWCEKAVLPGMKRIQIAIW